MSNYSIIKDLQMYLNEVVEADMKEWEGRDLDTDPDVIYDNGWHDGFARAIQKMSVLLDTTPTN